MTALSDLNIESNTCIPKALQLNEKSISFPYINPNNNTNTDPVNGLLVDIQEAKANTFTVSLKYAYREYYPNYDQYIKKHSSHTLYNQICDYFDTIIQTEIEYKYEIGRFGYLKSINSLERSFVKITGVSTLKKEIFFLHKELEIYEYLHHDITSSVPKVLILEGENNHEILKTSGWMKESQFIAINECVKVTNQITGLLNWKICREDYLTKKLQHRNKKNQQYLSQQSFEKQQRFNRNFMTTTTDDTITDFDENEENDEYTTEKSSSSYFTSDSDSFYNYNNNNNQNNNNDKTAHFKSKKRSYSAKQLALPTILEEHGYAKDEDFTQTLKGEIFVAINIENKSNTEEAIAIKRIYNQQIMVSNPSVHLIRDALILRNLKTNKVVRESTVNYIDFFQSRSDFYLVMELSFRVTLKEFVKQSHKYIENNQLTLNEYRETIKYLLWRLSATIHWLHNNAQMNRNDLDICPENIMLNKADFLQNSDGSVAIHLQIEMKLIDVGIRELLEMDGDKEKIKQCECSYNQKYLALENNEAYLLPNETMMKHTGYSRDTWAYGMVVYFCFLNQYPSSISHGKLKEYLTTQNSLINPKILSLLHGVLNIDPTKQFNMDNVLKHEWFNSFYKTYILLCNEENYQLK